MHSRNLSIYHGSKYAIYNCLLDFDFEDSVTPADDEIIVLPDKILERDLRPSKQGRWRLLISHYTYSYITSSRFFGCQPS